MKTTTDIAESCIRRAYSILKSHGSCIDLTDEEIEALIATAPDRWERGLSEQSFLGLSVNKIGDTSDPLA